MTGQLETSCSSRGQTAGARTYLAFGGSHLSSSSRAVILYFSMGNQFVSASSMNDDVVPNNGGVS